MTRMDRRMRPIKAAPTDHFVCYELVNIRVDLLPSSETWT